MRAQRLKVCFVGVGSIAKRHIKNLRLISEKRGIQLTVDGYRRLCACGEWVEGLDHIFHSIDCVADDYDVIFITNPTELHLETLQMFHDKGKHFFIEKPIVSVHQLAEARIFEKRKDSVYYVACPLRYNAVIQYIKNNISVEDVISIRSISSSYLPDWRPEQDYRDTYSAHRKLGGGVSIDLIHEWDYLTYLFGWPQKIYSLIGKKSSLQIDSDDYAIYIAEYANWITELHLDYFGRKTIRKIELFTKNETIIGDIANNRISFLCGGKDLDFQEDRNDYQVRELQYFLDMILGNADLEDYFQYSIKVLELTQGKLTSGKYKRNPYV